jgi:hypothetical protein
MRPLNEETFKSAVTELTKCTSDTSFTRNYVGDGDGDTQLAGSGIPPFALIVGESPGSEMLFKRSLHQVKALFETQVYLKNPSASEITAAGNQAVVLDGIAQVLNGLPCNNKHSSERSTSAAANYTSLGNGSITNKVVERLCSDEDPVEQYAVQKRKLDEMRNMLGEELYAAKVQQLK